jgi:hypothetical protein
MATAHRAALLRDPQFGRLTMFGNIIDDRPKPDRLTALFSRA